MLGIASAIFALCTRQLVLGCLILAYAQMQLSEAMIWYGIDKNKPEWNKIGTSFGKYLLATHNFAIGLGIILSIIFISKRKLKATDFIPVILGALFFLIIVVFVYLPSKYPDMTFPRSKTCDKCQNPENRLRWSFPHGWYLYGFALSLIFLFVWIKPLSSKYLCLLVFGLSLVVSSLIYPNTVGSVWCWSTSFIAPAVVLLNYYLIHKLPNSQILV